MTYSPHAPGPSRHHGTSVEHAVSGMRALGADRTSVAVMQVITSAAVSTGEAGDAGLTLIKGSDRFATMAPTSRLASAVDLLQYEHGGPCVDAITSAPTVIVVDDLRIDTRWPDFAARAIAETPVLSMLSLRLHLYPEQPIASLNLYATVPHAFDSNAVRAGEELAAFAAVALAHALAQANVDNLRIALRNSRNIGAAIGILMSRNLTTHDQAFDMLRVASQHANRKLHEVADDVLRTGEIPRVAPR